MVAVPKTGAGSAPPGGDPRKTRRPSALESVLGKLLQRVMIDITRKHLGGELSNENQYGFQRRKSAPLALRRILRSVQTAPGKHVMCLSMDISVAFDNVWYDLVIALDLRFDLK